MSITRDTLLFAASSILTLWAIASSVLGVSAIVREAWRGDLRAGTGGARGQRGAWACDRRMGTRGDAGAVA